MQRGKEIIAASANRAGRDGAVGAEDKSSFQRRKVRRRRSGVGTHRGRHQSGEGRKTAGGGETAGGGGGGGGETSALPVWSPQFWPTSPGGWCVSRPEERDVSPVWQMCRSISRKCGLLTPSNRHRWPAPPRLGAVASARHRFHR